MKNKGIAGGVAKSTKGIAKQTAKQLFQEPAEVLKTAGSQVAGQETTPPPSQEAVPHQTEKEPPPLNEEEIKMKGKRIIKALEEEIEDIRRQKEAEEQAKEQEEAEAQIEKEEEIKPLPEVSSKQSRGDARGIKGKIKKLKTKAEIRMPPSG